MTAKTDSAQSLKEQVGRAAADRVPANAVVGLGTGSTTAYAIQAIGGRLQAGQLGNIAGIPTSFQAEVLAKQYGIPLTSLDAVSHIDVAVDGADEVDPAKTLIKGGGAAHTREKVVDTFARTFIVAVDSGKLVSALGEKFRLPVEVIPMAQSPARRALEQLGGEPELRMGVNKAGPVVTDQGNLVFDVRFGSLENAAELEKTINNIPGVLENGLFVNAASTVLVGELQADRVRIREL